MDESSSRAPVASSSLRHSSNFPFFSLSLILSLSLHVDSFLFLVLSFVSHFFFLTHNSITEPAPPIVSSKSLVEIMCLLVCFICILHGSSNLA